MAGRLTLLLTYFLDSSDQLKTTLHADLIELDCSYTKTSSSQAALSRRVTKMEFKPLIDYAKAPERRRNIESQTESVFKALLGWCFVFTGMLLVCFMAGNAGYFN